ncbi:hypothetical protein PCANC_20676 [Puccinia coronata f. sp. avenae]|uniref:Uncharacterized protein n=1 Tax=Puccinia coronata f. sp. avenae TaxID=200324 RepID=A0A2N5UPZ5_9BASI|nr:hypothetical protein PCANC_20676 [Puccinia coronata f. sp. avenae]
MVPTTNAKTHWPEEEHDPSEYDKDHESSSGNDHELVTSRSRSSNRVRTPLNDLYRPVIKKNQSSRGARLLLMTGLHQPLRGGVLLLIADRSSRGVHTPLNDRERQERTPVNNPGRPVIKRSTPPLMTRLRWPLRGGILLLMAGPSRSLRGVRTPLDGRGVRAPPGNLDKSVVKRSTCLLGWYQLGKQLGKQVGLLAGLVPAQQAGRPARWAGTSSASR